MWKSLFSGLRFKCVTNLTSADLTWVSSWVETVAWTIYAALKHTVCGIKCLRVRSLQYKTLQNAVNMCSPAHTGQHSPGTLMKLMQGDRQRISEQVVTPSTHMQLIQGVEPANQLLPSSWFCPPYMHPDTGDDIIGTTVSISHYNRLIDLPRQRGQQAPGSVTWCIHGSLGQSGDAHLTSPACKLRLAPKHWKDMNDVRQ